MVKWKKKYWNGVGAAGVGAGVYRWMWWWQTERKKTLQSFTGQAFFPLHNVSSTLSQVFQENIPHVFIQEGEKGGGIKESGTELRIPVTISISDSQRRKCDDCFILFYFLSFQLFLDFLKSDFLWTFFTLGQFWECFQFSKLLYSKFFKHFVVLYWF